MQMERVYWKTMFLTAAEPRAINLTEHPKTQSIVQKVFLDYILWKRADWKGKAAEPGQQHWRRLQRVPSIPFPEKNFTRQWHGRKTYGILHRCRKGRHRYCRMGIPIWQRCCRWKKFHRWMTFGRSRMTWAAPMFWQPTLMYQRSQKAMRSFWVASEACCEEMDIRSSEWSFRCLRHWQELR